MSTLLPQLQPGVQGADAVELGRGREAGGHDGDFEPPAAAGPGQGLARHTSVAPPPLLRWGEHPAPGVPVRSDWIRTSFAELTPAAS